MQIPSHVQEHIETIARHEQEFYAKRSPADKIGDAVAGFAGNFAFVLIHVVAFIAWTFVNTAHVGPVPHFDPAPFAMLDTVVALEAILLASFILMRQSGLGKRADERDHLMLQILLLTEREVSAVVKITSRWLSASDSGLSQRTKRSRKWQSLLPLTMWRRLFRRT